MKTLLPDFLKPFGSRAKALLAAHAIEDLDFSGPTYQVHVLDPDERADLWVFLQLDPQGGISDCFCGCDESSENTGCSHVAAAYLRIFNGHIHPLHERFEGSLWNVLCRLFADKLGYESEVLKAGPGATYTSQNKDGGVIFKGRSAAGRLRLAEILVRRPRETEETSIKFSNLSEHDLLLWREGRPSTQLLYELSFWSDMAKWLMLLQEDSQVYDISFQYHKSQVLPVSLQVQFPDVLAKFAIERSDWPEIIPALATVKSPLISNEAEDERIAEMRYDIKTGVLHIKHQRKQKRAMLPPSSKIAGEQVGPWTFIPHEGFFRRQAHPLLASDNLEGESVAALLRQHATLVQRTLVGTSLHLEPIEPSFKLWFDEQWTLHIETYLFTKGDLTQPLSRDFGLWVYAADKGFYRLTSRYFDDLAIQIPSSQVSDFVTTHRLWLTAQSGFSPHLSSIDAEMSYRVADDFSLTMDSLLAIEEEAGRHRDFGAWIYVTGEGFYAKASRITASLPLRPGTVVPESNVSLFIRMFYDELQQVRGFFRKDPAILSAGLQISLEEQDTIVVSPHYELARDVQNRSVHLYGDFAYIAHEGFQELPPAARLPDRYANSFVVHADHLTNFLTHELPGLKSRVVDIDPRLTPPLSARFVLLALDKTKEPGWEWYQARIVLQTERGLVPLKDIYEAYQKRQRFIFSQAGLLDLHDSKFQWLKAIPKGHLNVDDDSLKLSVLELMRLHALYDLQPTTQRDSAGEEVRRLFRKVLSLEIEEPISLEGLTSTLRSYQMAGVQWLWSLYQHRLSGLLCDDMGLGKTHQAMALIAAIINLHRDSHHAPRFLIVCPTSVIYHWKEKLEEFLPHVSVCTYYGIDRSLAHFGTRESLLLTSYGLWRRESNHLKNLNFELAVFDEIQVAKTHTSRLHASLLDVKAVMRLGMTGTPIENRLRELKALFDIILPGYMPDDKEYRELFLKPIEKENDDSRRGLLRRFIHPFVLRRRKGEVLQDLPEKIEEIVHCELSQEQQRLYREALSLSRSTILQQLTDYTQAIPYIHIFALLSRLKQICNHPAAFLKRVDDYRHHHSGKWDLFVELLHEARDSSQKVVIFSQYLAMLDIFEAYMDDHDIGYAMIRGSTANRGEEIRRFNTDPDCEVFLGSIQASGLGVDLTAGSVVIHYDRWWNAARENQATDRVHRIGQTRGVQVFKLVTKDTFEERIDQLITSKGRLMEDVVGADDQEVLKRFNRDDLIQLLQDVELAKDPEEDSP